MVQRLTLVLPLSDPALYRHDRRWQLHRTGDDVPMRANEANEKGFIENLLARRLANFLLSGLFRI